MTRQIDRTDEVTEENGMMTICRPGETKIIRREDLGPRWCFVCRKRVPFTFTVTAEVEPSYYEPWTKVSCSAGHVDGDCFPGTCRE